MAIPTVSTATPRNRLSRERVLRAAIVHADAGGLEAGQPLQLHVEDRLGLELAQVVPAHEVRPGQVDVLRLADRRGVGCRDVSARERFIAFGAGELEHPVLEREDRVAAGDLPLPVGPVAREAIADLDGAEDPAGRAQQHGGIVFDPLSVGAPAQLGPGHLPGLLEALVDELLLDVAHDDVDPSFPVHRVGNQADIATDDLLAYWREHVR